MAKLSMKAHRVCIRCRQTKTVDFFPGPASFGAPVCQACVDRRLGIRRTGEESRGVLSATQARQ